MRITVIATEDERVAVAAAVRAADAVRERIADAALVELNAGIEGITKYKPLNVWGAGEDAGAHHSRPLLWCDVPDLGVSDALSDADVARLTGLLTTAGEADPNVFGPGELASGTWVLDLDAPLKVWVDDLTQRLVARIKELGLDEIALGELVYDAASRKASDAFNAGEGGGNDEQAHDTLHSEQEDLAGAVNNGGVEAQARFLIERLGEHAAFTVVSARSGECE